MSDIKETEWAYLAGLIDSKGSFLIRVRNDNGLKTDTVLKVYEKCRKIRDWILRTFGGAVFKRQNRYYPKTPPEYWISSRMSLLEICNRVTPF